MIRRKETTSSISLKNIGRKLSKENFPFQDNLRQTVVEETLRDLTCDGQ